VGLKRERRSSVLIIIAGKVMEFDIELNNVKKSFHTSAGAILALRGINLSIPSGEFLAIFGKSGAGKSTLVNMITGIDKADEGHISIGGTELHLMNEDQRARWRGLNMGVVFQFFQLLPSINLIRNVTIPMEFCGVYTPRERRRRSLDLLNKVGILEHACKRPSQVSGGQQQRVAIARALAIDPSIIIADEPTGNLDSKTAAEIMELFTELSKSGKTLIIVTHDKSIARRAMRVVEISDGAIK
jgi:putative ABC transport system ATP-binding protein